MSDMNIDVMKAVRESSMLADMNIGVWRAERTDKAAIEELKAAHGATGNVGRLMKNLLAGADGKLKETHAAFAAVRAMHNNMTLPWVSNPHAERLSGPRLLPTALAMDYLEKLSRGKREAMFKLNEFIDEYPVIVGQARANLGTLADQLYPSADEVKAKFRIDFTLEPVPDAASFRGLDQRMLDRLSTIMLEKQQRMVADATAAMWNEARTRVEHLVARLTEPDDDKFKKTKSTTIENVRELVHLMPGWNLLGAPQATEIVQEIDEMLTGIDRRKIVDDATTRSATTARAQAIVEKLNTWGV